MEEAKKRGRPPVRPCRLPPEIEEFIEEHLPSPPDPTCSWLPGNQQMFDVLPEDPAEDEAFDPVVAPGRRWADLHGEYGVTIRLMNELQQACRELAQDVQGCRPWEKIQQKHLIEFEGLAAQAGLKERRVIEWGFQPGDGAGSAFYRKRMSRLGLQPGPGLMLEPARHSTRKAVATRLASVCHLKPGYAPYKRFGAVCAAALDWLEQGFKCVVCGEPLDHEARRDRLYCRDKCRQWAYEHKDDFPYR